MWRRWIVSSSNQAPLYRVFDSIHQRGRDAHGKLIIVRGEAGAGVSAFASRLQSMLTRANIRSVFVPRTPFNADFVFYSHFLKSLGLPNSSFDLTSGRRIRLHYEAAIHLRCYQVVICPDAHDFFHKYQPKVGNIYDSLLQLTQSSHGFCVVLCGLHDPLTGVGHRAMGMGMDVEYVDIEAMPCDQSYLEFVRDVARAMWPLGNTTKCFSPFFLPLNAEASSTVVVPTGISLPPPPSIATALSSDAPTEEVRLGASSFLALNISPRDMRGIDVSTLHTHTKGLVGNTVSVVTGLMTDSSAGYGVDTDEAPASCTSVENSVSGVSSLKDAEFCQTAEMLEVPQESERPDVRQGLDRVEGASSSADEDVVHSDKPSAPGEPSFKESTSFVELARLKGGEGPYALTGCQRNHPENSDDMQLTLPFVGSQLPRVVVQLEFDFSDPVAQHSNSMGPQPMSCCTISEELIPATGPGQSSQVYDAPSALIDFSEQRSRRRIWTLKGYLTPLYDETLGSWISRNATSSSVVAIHEDFLNWCAGLLQPMHTSFAKATAQDLLHFQGAANTTAKHDLMDGKNVWDPEVLLGIPRSVISTTRAKDLECDDLYRSDVFREAFPGLPDTYLEFRFRLPSNALSPQENIRFCAQCVADDVATMRAPGLRLAWRNRGAAVCRSHRQPVLLQQLIKGNLSNFSGAWQAYMQQTTQGYFNPGIGLVSHNKLGHQPTSLETRICRTVLRVQNWVEYAPAIPSSKAPSKYALYFLLGVFLYQGNQNSEGGAARWFVKRIHGSKLDSYEYMQPSATQMVKNIETASPRSLAIGYLLLGFAFGLISEDEAYLLRRTFVFTDCVFPVTREELKSLTKCFQPYHCEAIWDSATRNLSTDDLVHLAWLLGDR